MSRAQKELYGRLWAEGGDGAMPAQPLVRGHQVVDARLLRGCQKQVVLEVVVPVSVCEREQRLVARDGNADGYLEDVVQTCPGYFRGGGLGGITELAELLPGVSLQSLF